LAHAPFVFSIIKDGLFMQTGSSRSNKDFYVSHTLYSCTTE
jgi:hypothetical protein